jgi:hypothetical protein
MKRLKMVIFAICFVCLAANAADESKKGDIIKILDITNSYRIASMVMDQVLMVLKPMAPDVPEKVWKEFSNKINKDVLYDMVIPIYDKYLTHDDIKALIKFYKTPVGQKFIKVTPDITQESMMAGQQLGQRLMMEIINEIKAKGYKIKEI